MNLLEKIDEYDVFSDCEEVRKNFKLLEKIYPEAKFILNTRDVNQWIIPSLHLFSLKTPILDCNEVRAKNIKYF